MLRIVLVVLALIALIAAALFYFGILHWPGPGQPVQSNPVQVKVETQSVNLPAPVISVGEGQPANGAQPAPAPAN